MIPLLVCLAAMAWGYFLGFVVGQAAAHLKLRRAERLAEEILRLDARDGEDMRALNDLYRESLNP